MLGFVDRFSFNKRCSQGVKPANISNNYINGGLNNITPNRHIDNLCKLLRRFRLRECPHDLGEDGFGRHAVSLGELVFLLDAESDLIDRHVAALVGNLRGDDDSDALFDKHFDLVGEFVILVVGKSADTEGFDYDRVRVVCNIIEDVRTHTGDELDEHYACVDLVVELNRLGVAFLYIVAHLAAADESDLGVVNARKGVCAARAVLSCSCSGNYLAAEYDMDSAGVLVRCVNEGVAKILAGVGVAVFDGSLCSGQNDRLLAVLNQEVEHARRVSHCVGAVRDDESVVIVIFLADLARKLEPILGAHVRAVKAEERGHADVANCADLGDVSQQHLARNCGDKSVRTRRRCNRSACGDEKYMFHFCRPFDLNSIIIPRFCPPYKYFTEKDLTKSEK